MRRFSFQMPLHGFRNIVLTVIHRILCRLDQLCSIASVTPSYIAESPWPVRRKSISQPTSQRGSKYDHLYSPISKQPKPEMKIDVELAAQLEVRRMEKWRKKSPQVRTPSLGKRKRRPQTAASSPRPASRKLFQEDATDTTLNSALLVKSVTQCQPLHVDSVT